ncbi:Abi family protein [Chitinimonas sp. JJ19]|uniref:Abi family protein n=1 Tax=Chitinimonas sp. JJ19 TaxID=3109352 RepID=UPI003002F507
MKYTKVALEIPALILRLQAKGLVVPDAAHAERVLRSIGYFRFRGYGLALMQPAPAAFAHGTRIFNPGVTFDQVYDLYLFDRALRCLIMDQIDRIEVAARTAIIYELNRLFGPHWYIDFSRNIFKKTDDQAKWFGDVSRDVHKSKEKFIQHYFSKYTAPILPPSWAIAECLSFGKWSLLYKELTHGKSAIATTFALSPPVFESWLHTLTHLRNACAHHSRLWDRLFPFPPKSHPRHPAHFSNAALLYPRLAAIRIMTNAIDGNNALRDGLLSLFSMYAGVSPVQMGFPIAWSTDPLWR